MRTAETNTATIRSGFLREMNDKSCIIKHNDFSVESIAESGQCFRITRTGNDEYRINALGRLLCVQAIGDGEYRFSCDEDEFDKVWRDYFDLNNDYDRYKAVALPDDEYLKKAIGFGSGIRILNQEPWEMLISFIISQRKSVPAIRTSVERLSRLYGKEIGESGEYTFPRPEALAAAGEEALSSCGLGYRVEYIRDAAELVASGELDLYEINKYSTDELTDRLMELKGVGIKVASCVALFGYHRLDTVPVDVWMKRVIDTVYGGKLPEEYAPYAGVLQQYMFNYARINKVGI